MGYPIHPYADLIPPMTVAEYVELRESIRANGLMRAITLYEGMVLDGRHRLRACAEVGVSPQYETYGGNAPLAFVVGTNLARRHLTTSQRGAIGARMLAVFEREAHERQIAAGEHGMQGGRGKTKTLGSNSTQGFGKATNGTRRNPRATERAAEMAGVGKSVVQQGKAVLNREPDLFGAVERGEIAMNTAYRQVTGKESGQETKKAPTPRANPSLLETAPTPAPKTESVHGYKVAFRKQERENEALRAKLGEAELATLAARANLRQESRDMAAMQISRFDAERTARIKEMALYLALAERELTEGQVCDALGMIPVTLRKRKHDAIREGIEAWRVRRSRAAAD